MMEGRRRLAACILASLLTLGGCDQIEQAIRRIQGEAPAGVGPAPLADVSLEARALSGSVLPQDQIAALLAPAPVLVAPGEILVGARSEAEAAATASDDARDVLTRLGVASELQVRAGGLIVVRLGAAPTAQAADAPPVAIEWNDADRCPRIVTQAQLENDLALATRCAVQRLRASRRFAYVEPNYIAGADQAPSPAAPAATAGGSPDDPLSGLQWNFRPRGSGAGQSPGGAGFQSFWDARFVGSRQIRVAVLDTGLDATHPDMRASPNLGAGIDLVSDVQRAGDGDGIDADAQDAGDRCAAATENSYHGTSVAGIIGAGASNDRVGVAGGAWVVSVAPVRVLGRCGGELADIVAGIRWAAAIDTAATAGGNPIANPAAADIINMSLSIQAPCPASMQAAIDAAVARNAVVVVAAGNKANQTALFAPANCNNVIVVAAGDARGELAFYSNFGPEVDVLAPGGDMFADSDRDGRPDGVLTPRATQIGCYDPLNQNSTGRCYYAFSQGTSMAAPHVSAALALIAARTGLRGRALENTLVTRALAPLAPEFGQIECARSRNATPLREGSPACARPSGRGALDLSRALSLP